MWWLPWTRKSFQPCRSIDAQTRVLTATSYGDFQNPLLAAGTGLSNVYGQATFDRLVEILQQFLKGLALGRTAEAEALLRATLATAQQRGIFSMQWRIQVRLAALEYAQGRRDEAQAAGAAARACVADLATSLADETLRATFTHAVDALLPRIPPPSPRQAAKQAYDGLTTRERELLRLFIQNAGRPITRAELSPDGAEDNARTVDVQINRLRQKIEEDPSNPIYLQTVRGAGYTLHVD